jgi:hypothetical protein
MRITRQQFDLYLDVAMLFLDDGLDFDVRERVLRTPVTMPDGRMIMPTEMTKYDLESLAAGIQEFVFIELQEIPPLLRSAEALRKSDGNIPTFAGIYPQHLSPPPTPREG